MRAIAGSLTDQDMADMAAYYEQHGKDAAAAARAGRAAPPADVAALLTKGACASCHGANFSKPIDGSYPKLAGQHADYLYVALKAYQTEGNPQVGRGNADHGRAGQAVQPRRAEGDRGLHRFAAGRVAHRAAGQVPLNAARVRRRPPEGGLFHGGRGRPDSLPARLSRIGQSGR